MAWQILDFDTVVPPNFPTPVVRKHALFEMSNAEMSLFFGGTFANGKTSANYGGIPSLDSFVPVPWGLAGPTILSPTIGTVFTDCGPSGCDGGGGGDSRPPVGLLYPRGSAP